MYDADPRPLNLAVLREDTWLTVVLTDTRSVARCGRIAVNPARLGEIQARAAQVSGQAAASRDAMRQLRELGSAIYVQLLPEDIRSFLTRCPARFLHLQVSESLIAIPWEVAFDGGTFLGEKFRISRQIVSDDAVAAPPAARPDRGILKVLVVSGGGAQPRAAYRENLLARLGTIEEIAAQGVDAHTLPRKEALSLIGESDVVHYIGPVRGNSGADGDPAWWQGGEPVSLREIAALPYPPQLLVSENTDTVHLVAPNAQDGRALARAACRAGLNVLVRDPLPAHETGDGFMLEIYRELARNSALGEAVRHATATTRRPDAISASVMAATLYGDATLVPFPRTDRAPQHDHVRQVTIMSYDLVDSTRLLDALGAEEYSKKLKSFQDHCRRIVKLRGGDPDVPQGDDGIMCYFGVPVAYENSAAQSVRAALEIIDKVADLEVRVRIGIVTGQVVVRDGQRYGMPIHLAARLQSIAEPGTVVIAESTRVIVKDRFVVERLTHVPRLKGFDSLAAVYRVLGETSTSVTDWFDASAQVTPFVGRKRELGLIQEHWAAVCNGGLKTVVVSGDAGIGKSRLIHEFRRSLAVPSHEAIELRCTPDHVNSAYHPAIDFLRRLLRIQDSDDDASRLNKIDAAAVRIGIDGAAPLLAGLLSVPQEAQERYGRLEHTDERRRQLTLDLLVNWIRREAERAPLCLIVEDIQWMDPSTRELVHRIIVEAARAPLLVLLTQRSDAQARNHGFTAHEIELKGLSGEAAREMIAGACGASSIPNEVMRLLAEKSDGVPLFIEESARMMIDDREAARAGAAPVEGFTVPASIEDLLMARLDRVATAKEVAQLGGTIGREFPLALLEAVLRHESSPIKTENLAARLDALVYSGLLVEKGTRPNTSYFFKHALVREAASRSLLPSIRVSLHRTIALVISERFRELAQAQPELLAHHYTEAGSYPEAVEYWERAARGATSRSARIEAISHATSGLAAVAHLPLPEREYRELALRLQLGVQLIAVEGYGADRVERVYARAAELWQRVGDESALLKIQAAFEGYHFMRADFDQAHAIAVQTAAIVSRSPDRKRRIQSQWMVANILFHQGELASAVERMDACFAEYVDIGHRRDAVQDTGVICLCYSAWGKWQLGYPDEAIGRARRVIGLAEGLNHKFSMGQAFGFATSVHHFRGENDEALKCAERAIGICEEYGFTVWLAHAKLMRGRIVAELGDSGAGLAEMEQAYRMWTASGAVVTTPFYLALQAEGLALAGRPEDGLALLQRAYETVCRYRERYYEAEVMRLTGELTLQSAKLRGRDGSEEAERWFLGALESARERQLNSMTLRAATSLARLRMAQGRPAEALQVLAPAHEQVVEGRDTRDVRAAGALIENVRVASATARNAMLAAGNSPLTG